MANTEEGMGEQEGFGSDAAGGSTLSRPPAPGSQETGSAEVRPEDGDSELPPVVDGPDLVD